MTTAESVAAPPAHSSPAHFFELDAGRFLVRAVTLADEPAMLRLLQRASPEDIWLRFFHAMRRFSPELTGALVHPDDDLHIGLVAVAVSGAADEIAASAMLVGAGDRNDAEFALLVHRDHARHGLGRHLLECLLAGARHRGIARVHGLVLRENRTMLDLAREMGFTLRADADETGCMRVEWVLMRPHQTARLPPR